MIQPQFDIVLHVNAHRSQVLVSVGDDDLVVLLEGCQGLSLIGSQVLPARPPMEEAPQSFQEVIDAIINL